MNPCALRNLSAPVLDSHSTRPPQVWEAGCAGDPIRNNFVIPVLERAIGRSQPTSIADIGCGTGYISRNLIVRLNQPTIQWHLVDIEPAMLGFAKHHAPHDDIVLHQLDLRDERLTARLDCDLAFIAYTFLDVKFNEVIAHNISRFVRTDGHLLIFLPDVLEDVINASQRSSEPLTSYRDGHCTLEKIDKFTQLSVGFEANRIELVLELLLNAGFALVQIEPHLTPEGRRQHCFSLRRLMQGSK